MTRTAAFVGFLAITRQPQLARFLRWWQEKLTFDCVVDTAQGLFVDQKWMDLAPGPPVAYELVTLDRDHGPYQAGQTWAEPDLEHAARLMRRVVDDDAYRAQLGARARHTVRTEFSPRAAGLRYRRRLEFLGLLAP